MRWESGIRRCGVWTASHQPPPWESFSRWHKRTGRRRQRQRQQFQVVDEPTCNWWRSINMPLVRGEFAWQLPVASALTRPANGPTWWLDLTKRLLQCLLLEWPCSKQRQQMAEMHWGKTSSHLKIITSNDIDMESHYKCQQVDFLWEDRSIAIHLFILIALIGYVLLLIWNCNDCQTKSQLLCSSMSTNFVCSALFVIQVVRSSVDKAVSQIWRIPQGWCSLLPFARRVLLLPSIHVSPPKVFLHPGLQQ